MTAEKALVDWLEGNRDRVGGALRASQLKLIARAKTFDPGDIESRLPGPAKHLALEIASVLRPYGASDEPDAAPDVPDEAPASMGSTESVRTAAATAGRAALVDVAFPTYFPQTLETDLPEAQVAQAEGRIRLAWKDRSEHEVAIYRVVSSHAGPPYHPDRADAVAVTGATSAIDDAPFLDAVRYYRIWAYEGATRDEALEAEPRQVATATAVAQVAVDLKQASHSSVIAKWTVAAGVTEVRLYRLLPHEAPHGGTDLQYRILESEDVRAGFVDREVEPGRTYVYRVVAVATDHRGLPLRSEASEFTLEVPAQLLPITDIDGGFRELGNGVRVVDLRWTTPPNGAVRIYMTEQEPDARALDGEWDDRPEVLAQMGLQAEAVQAHPFGPVEGGLTVMPGVDWKIGSTRLYFTPTVTLNGKIRVGRSRSLVNSSPPTGAELVERVYGQVVRFEWPPGAASVSLTEGPLGGVPPHPGAGAAYEVSAAQYHDRGGFTFPKRLSPKGSAVYLWGVAHDAGQQYPSRVVRLEYPGLAVARYQLALRGATMFKPGSVTVTVWTPDESLPPARFLLVHNPDRFPLSEQDRGHQGSAIPMRLAVEDGAALQPMMQTRAPIRGGDQPIAWVGDLGKRTGWFRLFASTPPGHPPLALLDPRAETLRLA